MNFGIFSKNYEIKRGIENLENSNVKLVALENFFKKILKITRLYQIIRNRYH